MCFLRKNEKLLSILNFQFHETIRFENSTLSDLKIKSPSFARSHRLVNFFPALNFSLSLRLSPGKLGQKLAEP